MPQQPKRRRSAHPKPPRPQVSVGVIIAKDKQVLLLRRSSAPEEGAWSTPGGHLEYGESPQQCAIRQAQKEAGITITHPVFRAITNAVFEEEQRHDLTIWVEGTYVSGEPFEHLLTGQCDPAPWNFSESDL